MERIDAYYQFQINKINEVGIYYAITPLYKRGNDTLLNKLFECANQSKIRKIGPIPDMGDYISFDVNLSTREGVLLSISFQSSSLSYPYGIVRYPEMRDAVLFKIVNEEIFEVFVFKNEKGNSLNYLQLLINGDLDDMISETKSALLSQPHI